MNTRYILTLIASMAVSSGLYAQYNQDAYRFSTSDRAGTARFKAIGNASTALGGDLSSISNNPAGLGFFSGSEFNFTPELNTFNSKSTYFGDESSTENNKFNLNNVGVVFTTKGWVQAGKDPGKGLLSLSIGLAYNRTNNFYTHSYFAGRNTNSSIADRFAEDATVNGIPDGSLQKWAYEHFLIDEVSSNRYEANTALGSDQVNDIVSTGGQNEFDISFGANISNKFYFGAGVGIASLRYNSTNTYTEEGDQYIDELEYKTTRIIDQTTTGSGINLKLGFIYKPTNAVRFGASLTSPTWYNVKDNTTAELLTVYKESDTYRSGPEEYILDYNLRTPLKLNAGLAVFFNKMGFISADIEHVDYGGMHLGSSYDYNASSDNRRLAKQYQSTVNARIGGELKLDNIALRAGYSYYENPEKGIGSAINSVSSGIGYRFGNYYFDLTYVNTVSKPTLYPYELDPSYSGDPGNPFFSPAANLKNQSDNVFLTIGMRF